MVDGPSSGPGEHVVLLVEEENKNVHEHVPIRLRQGMGRSARGLRKK